jgi:hypothetical protein
LLYLAWKHGGHDPYRMFHNLDDNYYPMRGGGERMPPPYPARLRAVIYGFAMVAEEDAVKMAGGRVG